MVSCFYFGGGEGGNLKVKAQKDKRWKKYPTVSGRPNRLWKKSG